MDVCKTILEAMTCALESEERRLKPRSEQKPELWPWTVRGGYREDWVRFLLVRELSELFRDRELEIETKVGGFPQVDLSIRGLFSAELKGPYLVKKKFNKGLYNKILEDFAKQRCRATATKTKEPNLKHFVLLIVHAPKRKFDSGSVQRWLDRLESKVRKEVPDICIRLQPSKPLILNGEKTWLMEVCLYSVE